MERSTRTWQCPSRGKGRAGAAIRHCQSPQSVPAGAVDLLCKSPDTQHWLSLLHASLPVLRKCWGGICSENKSHCCKLFIPSKRPSKHFPAAGVPLVAAGPPWRLQGCVSLSPVAPLGLLSPSVSLHWPQGLSGFRLSSGREHFICISAELFCSTGSLPG